MVLTVTATTAPGLMLHCCCKARPLLLWYLQYLVPQTFSTAGSSALRHDFSRTPLQGSGLAVNPFTLAALFSL